MSDRLESFLLWTVLLVGAPVLLALVVALHVRDALGRHRYRAMLAGARALVRTVREGVLELDDGVSVDGRSIVRVDRWVQMIHGGYASNDGEEHALCFETTDGAYYVMVTESPIKANKTFESFGFAPGRIRSGGRDVDEPAFYIVLVPATLLWLAVVSQLV